MTSLTIHTMSHPHSIPMKYSGWASEILHQLLVETHPSYWDKAFINWCRISS
jgi:hypothetical protein